MSSEKEKLWWETQKNGQWKDLVNPLTKSHTINSRLDSFIKDFYWRFREKKGYQRGIYNPEIDFQGFREFVTNKEELLGRCDSEVKIKVKQTLLNGKVVEEQTIYLGKMSIIINQFYLLSKLGMNKLITDYSPTTISYKDASLDQLINTIAHELAHAYQNTINLKKEAGEKSQCESTGGRDNNGKLLHPQLATEHTHLTTEIKQMIVNSSEYQIFKNWWTSKQPLQEEKQTPCHDEEKMLLDFFLLIYNSEDLTDLEKNYQITKSGTFYNNEKNGYESRKKIDDFYTNTKSYLINQSSKSNDRIKNITLFLVVIGVISIIWLMLSRQKKRKKRY